MSTLQTLRFQKIYEGKMKLIEFSRKYAVDRLGFDAGNAFEYVIDEDCYYALAYTSKIGFEYFKCLIFKKEDDVIQEKNKLSLDNDVSLRYVEGYGGGGIGDYCQITKSLLNGYPERVVYMVLHEKWHDFVKDYALNERTRMIDEAAGDSIAFKEAINILKNFKYLNKYDYLFAISARRNILRQGNIVNGLFKHLYELYKLDKPSDEITEAKEKILRRFDIKAKIILGVNYRYITKQAYFHNNASVADKYVYSALRPLTEDICNRHDTKRSIEIFAEAMKTAKKEGFNAGVEELLRHSDMTKDNLKNVVNICDSFKSTTN